jgi:hypothetical protein
MSSSRGVLRCMAIALLVFAGAERGNAVTLDLPLNGTVSLAGDLPASYHPSTFGPIQIGIQVVEDFPLPIFNPANPANTVAMYQWSTSFSVLNQNGSAIPEPDLSPLGTALTGYGQNCNSVPFCPRPSGDSSETILAGYLYVSPEALTLQISTDIFALNVPSYDLQLQVTLPDGLSITPIPTALSLFASGLGFVGLMCLRRNRKTRMVD